MSVFVIKEAFIGNFSAPYSLLQRHLVGEEDRRGGGEEEENKQRSRPRLLITELTTSSFLPSVMDLQKVSVSFSLNVFTLHPV